MIIEDYDKEIWNHILKDIYEESEQPVDISMVASPNGEIIGNSSTIEDERISKAIISNSAALQAAVFQLMQMLTHRLGIGDIEAIQIEGQRQYFLIQTIDVNHNIIFVSNEIKTPDKLQKNILKNIIKNFFFPISKNEDLAEQDAIALISSDGLPIWSIGKIDSFDFSLAISGALSLIERITIEMDLKDVQECEILGESLTISTIYDESRNNILSISTSEPSANFTILEELFKKIMGSRSQQVKIPEWSTVIDEREQYLAQLRDTEYEGDPEEEMETLQTFNQELIESIKNKILELQKRYRTREISIPYLCKYTKLPPEVIQLTLNFLITSGELGEANLAISYTTSGKEVEVIVLDDIVMQEDSAANPIFVLKEALLDAVEPYFSRIEDDLAQLKQKVSDTLNLYDQTINEKTVIRSLTDFSSLIMIKDQLKSISSDLRHDQLTMELLNKQTDLVSQESEENWLGDIITRKEGIKKRINTNMSKLLLKIEDFRTELLKITELLSYLLPWPHKIILNNEQIEKAHLFFACQDKNCDVEIEIEDKLQPWIKLIFFYNLSTKAKIDINCYPIEVREKYQSLKKQWNNLMRLDQENLDNLDNLNKLIMTNGERDLMLYVLENSGFYKQLSQCKSCGTWKCDIHFKEGQCVNCKTN